MIRPALVLTARLCLVAGAFCVVNAALAQSFPTKPVRIVVPYPAGGVSDFAARLLTQGLTDRLGQPVIVENRPGASGSIGAVAVAKSPPDGHTLLVASSGMLSVAPHLFKNLPYDVDRDFSPISNLLGGPSWLITHPSVPAGTVKELIALAKAKPGALTYGSAGQGLASHLSAELLKMMAGVDILHVPYKGTAPVTNDLLGGQISLTFSTAIENVQFANQGRIRILAVTSLKRSPITPEVPTMDESGLKGFEIISWNGILAPAGTPRDVVERLNRDITEVIKSPALRERVEKLGNFVIGDSPAAFSAYIRSESAKWAKVVRQANIKVE